MEKLTVGVAGASRGNDYLRWFQQMPETTVTAIMDPDAQVLTECADLHDIPQRFTDYDQMLDSGVDLVYLASPMPFHAPQAIAALDRGIHVLSEVTAAVSLEQCRALLRSARKSRAKYMLAENYLFIRSNLLVKELVRAGLFGEVYFAEGEYIHNVQALHRDRHGNPTWRVEWQVGKQGVTYGTHSLGPVLDWLGQEVVEVNCVGTGVHTVPGYVNDDTTLMACRTDGGALVRIRVDMVSWRPHIMNYYSIQGTRGCYEAPRTPDGEHRIWLSGHSRDPNRWQSLWDFQAFLPAAFQVLPPFARNAHHWGGDYYTVRSFVDAVVHDTEPPIGIEKALQFTVPGLVSGQSLADGGRVVPVPSIPSLLSAE